MTKSSVTVVKRCSILTGYVAIVRQIHMHRTPHSILQVYIPEMLV